MGQHIAQSMHDSVGRVLTKIVTLLPGILAFVLVLLIFLGLAYGLAWCTRRLLVALRFDARFEQNEQLIEWTQSPAQSVARIVFWLVLLLGFLVGVSAFAAGSYDTGLSTYVFIFIPRLVGALILLFLGNLIARVLSRSVLISAVNMNLHYARFMSTAVKWLVLVFTLAMVLDHLGIGARIVDLAFGILFGGIVLSMALAVGLGARGLVERSLNREVASVRPAPTPVRSEQFHHF